MSEPIVEREALRRRLAGLEGAIEFLGPYAEDDDLIVEWPPHHYQAKENGKRSDGAFKALRWIEEEIKRVRSRLETFERFPAASPRTRESDP